MVKNQHNYNASRETKTLNKARAKDRKRYRQIVQELGARNITLNDISNGLEGKQRGFIDMIESTGMTMDEVVVLQQYARAVVDQDTRAAEFLRDTAGDKPSQVIDLNDTSNGLAKMSYDELLALRDEIEAYNNTHTVESESEDDR